jgi:hypothetical protein
MHDMMYVHIIYIYVCEQEYTQFESNFENFSI